MSRRAVLFLFFAGIVFISVFGGLITLLMMWRVRKRRQHENEIYQVQTFDPSSNETQTSLATFHRSMKEDFMSYPNSGGVYTTVTKLSPIEYDCYGECFCERNSYEHYNYRRRAMSVVSKPLYFLISAISVSLAVKIASQYFQDRCVDILQEQCSVDHVVAEVQDCNRIVAKKAKVVFNQRKSREDNFKRFICAGFCLPNSKIKREDNMLAMEMFKCEDHDLQEVVVSVPVANPPNLDNFATAMNRRAKRKFNTDHLKPFCKTVSRHEFTTGEEYSYEYETKKKSAGGVRVIKQNRNIGLCTATTNKGFWAQLKNIKCNVIK